jgi:hypothetical protein
MAVPAIGLGTILAETVDAPSRVRPGRLPPVVACGLQRAGDVQGWQVRQRVPIADTLDVFEKEQLLTVRTVEHLHRLAFPWGGVPWPRSRCHACPHAMAWLTLRGGVTPPAPGRSPVVAAVSRPIQRRRGQTCWSFPGFHAPTQWRPGLGGLGARGDGFASCLGAAARFGTSRCHRPRGLETLPCRSP